jgi:hypothetical protein
VPTEEERWAARDAKKQAKDERRAARHDQERLAAMERKRKKPQTAAQARTGPIGESDAN